MDASQAARQFDAIQQMARNRSMSQSSSAPFPNNSQSFSNLNPFQPTSDPANAMQSSQQLQMQVNARKLSFFTTLHQSMLKRGTPLPSELTGRPLPDGMDPFHQFRHIELGSGPGMFRLAGKDVDIFKLWATVTQAGGSQALTANGNWQAMLQVFQLPQMLPQPQANGNNSTAQALAHYYSMILGPFEEMYKGNMANQQEMMRGQMAARGGAPGIGRGGPFAPQAGQNPMAGGMNPMAAGLSQNMAPGASNNIPNAPLPNFDGISGQAPVDGSSLDPNMLKRKSESEEDSKRVRAKTEPTEGALPNGDANSIPSGPVRTRQQPSRRKIEYIPLAREVDTYGGYDLKEVELQDLTLDKRRPIRDVSEWGVVDIEALTMSLRSRLSVELSYSLTTFTLLSTMRSQLPNQGFPVTQATDLLEELLDLMEDLAFDGVEDTADVDEEVFTNHELVEAVYDAETCPFAALDSPQGSRDPDTGPVLRPGHTILSCMNIIRNLSALENNLDYMMRHERLLDIVLRLCVVHRKDPSATPTPVSSVLSLTDVLEIRKDAIYILGAFAVHLRLRIDPAAPEWTRTLHRIVNLIASYLTDPNETMTPFNYIQLAGAGGPNVSIRPPILADVALDVFTRLAHTDSNRHTLSKICSLPLLRSLFENLLHRLPVTEYDFQLITKESWASYTEKTILALYTISFFAPPSFKKEIKKDRNLGARTILFRMVKHFAMQRGLFGQMIRRVVETLKMLDEAKDSFDISKSDAPTMAFGMGYGENVETSVELGTGILGGYRDLTWDLMLHEDIVLDDICFRELDSLSRIAVS